MGTGPYMLTDWVDGSSITHNRNPDYWGFDGKYPNNRLPYFDQLSGLIMPESATILAALRSGQLDYVGRSGLAEFISLAEKTSIERTNPGITLYPYEAVRDAITVEEQQRAVKAADMYYIKNHIVTWGPMVPNFNTVQPWLKGYNGEATLGGDDRILVFSRLWFDHDLMKEMGQ